MTGRRVQRLNSLLREVISEVISKDLHHIPGVDSAISITTVEITRDLRYAKVYFTLVGSKEEKEKVQKALKHASRSIQLVARKKVVMKIFPQLEFLIDEGLEKQLRIHELLEKVCPPSDDTV